MRTVYRSPLRQPEMVAFFSLVHIYWKLKIKNMKSFKQWLVNLFKDGNDINEKSVIGFMSFFVMTGFAVTDLVTGYMGKPLVINEFIYNSFLIMTLGAFGISSVDKFINSKYEGNNQQSSETPVE